MTLSVELYPKSGVLTARASYCAEETQQTPYFLLNRDFKVNMVICDGKEVPFCSEQVPVAGWNYSVQKVRTAQASALTVVYTGELSGETGCFPYVRERITEEFTYLRWETFPYPFFCPPESKAIFARLWVLGKADINIGVPAGFTVVAAEKLVRKEAETEDRICFSYGGNEIRYNYFNCSIARYEKLSAAVGDFYLLDQKVAVDLEDIMKTASEYMSQHFGKRDSLSRIQYAAVPDGYGSFACQDAGVVFIQQSAFRSMEGMSQMVHEWIHLGWNAPADQKEQRVRFFDEAFTCYFELRVMEAAAGMDKYKEYVETYRKQMRSGEYQLVPISEFGAYGYGDLSYTIGAIFLYELCDLMGQERFDRVTTGFLNKYRDTPVTLEQFCKEYAAGAESGQHNRVEAFLRSWIYSVEEYSKYLD